MDSRIQLITNLKDCLSSHNSIVQLARSEATPEEPSPEDVEYMLIRRQIVDSSFLKLANRHVKIRLHKWLEYLDKIKSNKVWIKSRNKYIKLLNLMCYCECLIFPYNSLPPEGELPTLRKHEINRIIDEVEHFVKNHSALSKRENQQLQTSFLDSTSQRSHKVYTKQNRIAGQLKENHQFVDQDSTETMPLKKVDFNTRSHTEASKDEATIPLKIYGSTKKKVNTEADSVGIPKKLSSAYRKEICHSSVEKTQKPKIYLKEHKSNSIEGKDLKTKKELPHQIGKNQGGKENTENMKTLALPPKYKGKPTQEKKWEKQTISAISREYWQSLSNSEVHTPKYLSNYSSQQLAVEEQCVEIVSFRGEKEGEGCDCAGRVFGQGWLSQLINKIIS